MVFFPSLDDFFIDFDVCQIFCYVFWHQVTVASLNILISSKDVHHLDVISTDPFCSVFSLVHAFLEVELIVLNALEWISKSANRRTSVLFTQAILIHAYVLLTLVTLMEVLIFTVLSFIYFISSDEDPCLEQVSVFEPQDYV